MTTSSKAALQTAEQAFSSPITKGVATGGAYAAILGVLFAMNTQLGEMRTDLRAQLAQQTEMVAVQRQLLSDSDQAREQRAANKAGIESNRADLAELRADQRVMKTELDARASQWHQAMDTWRDLAERRKRSR